jgi:hypothetical protein
MFSSLSVTWVFFTSRDTDLLFRGSLERFIKVLVEIAEAADDGALYVADPAAWREKRQQEFLRTAGQLSIKVDDDDEDPDWWRGVYLDNMTGNKRSFIRPGYFA